jgi:hypothetical protein
MSAPEDQCKNRDKPEEKEGKGVGWHGDAFGNAWIVEYWVWWTLKLTDEVSRNRRSPTRPGANYFGNEHWVGSDGGVVAG